MTEKRNTYLDAFLGTEEFRSPASLLEAAAQLEATLPEKALLEASKAAKALQEVVKKARLIQRIGDKEHLRVEAWQTLGAFYGVTAEIEWTRPIKPSGSVDATVGYTARGVALWHGQKI